MSTSSVQSSPVEPVAVHEGSIGGTVHGGSQPVTGATVKLYAAGSSGYGSPGTLLATTSTDANAAFGFTQATSGTYPATGTTYVCPSGSSQLYIVVHGGVADGSGNAGHANTAAAFLAVLGPCSGVNKNTKVFLDELVTAATVTALQQYISPGTVAGGESIGTSSSTQGATGLANAVLALGNLINVNTGATIVSTTYAGGTSANTGTADTLSTVNNVSVTATPEAAKIVTLADILASCVNSANSSSQNCLNLFDSAQAPLNTTTSQPAAVYSRPADVVQAMYLMATFPAQSGTFVASVSNTNTTCKSTNLACEYSLVPSTGAPYQTGLGGAPSDWTVGVTFTATGNCNAVGDSTLTSTGPFLNGAYKGNVDANGNLWFVNANAFPVGAASGTPTPVNAAEISPMGVPLACIGGSASGGRGLTIDPSGNVWASFSAASPANILEFTALATATGTNNVPYTTYTAGTVPAAGVSSTMIASDGNGNIGFIHGGTSATAPYQTLYLLNPTATTPAWKAVAMLGGTLGSSNSSPTALVVDHLGRFFSTDTQLSSGIFEAYPSTATSGYTGVTVAGLVASAAADYGLAVGDVTASGVTTDNVFSGTTCCGTYGASSDYKKIEKYTSADNTLPGTFTPTTSAVYAGGINGVRAVGVDGAGNVFASSEFPATTGGVYSVSELSSSLNSISLVGTPAYCSTSASPVAPATPYCSTNGGYQKTDLNTAREIAVDPSGNVWVLNTAASLSSNTTYTGTTITEVVGAGVPAVTPLSAAASTGSLGTKP